MRALRGRRRAARAVLRAGLPGAALLLLVQCTSQGDGEARPGAEAIERARAGVHGAAGAASAGAAATGWDVIYDVLQHPRCLNCHPAGDLPLAGDGTAGHPQNVPRGPTGEGLYAMRCSACHQAQNTPGAHMPPGAPAWHLPHPDTPLVFEGVGSAQLCRQLADPATNGGRTPEQLLEHMASDPLVLWGWAPGDGRLPVPTPHEEFLQAVRAWVGSGCGCPE
jgi:hypothetical protein